jgi:hypothetical protein
MDLLHYFGKLNPDPHKSKILELSRPKMESWRVVDAHNGGREAHKGALEGV